MTSATQNIVLHLVTSLDFGGVETHMETLALQAEAVPTPLLFCAIGGGGAVEARMRQLGAEVVCLRKPVRLPALLSIVALYRLFRKVRPLVVHTHGSEANFCGLIAAWLARVPVRIGEEIGIPTHGLKARIAFRAVYALAHRVAGISNAVVDWLVANGEIPRRKGVRLYCPVQLPEFGPRPPELGTTFRIGFVGRLEAVKNPVSLLDAVADLRATGLPAELWVIGDGSQREMLEQHAQRAGVSDDVVFYGYYPGNPAELVRQCHVYVQPSLSEGFGLAFVEAMGCGVPVIVTATGAAPEIVEHDVTGWVLATGDAVSLAQCLRSAHSSGASNLAAIGEKARAAVERRFLPGAYLTEAHAVYLQVLGRRRVVPDVA